MTHNKTITRLLIANRGEISVRIMQSAQKMGIHCIAIYSDADKHALHVQQADEAYHIGPSPAKESYLCVDKILAIAKQSQADAIHPGYGFLSENAEFAQAIIQAGLIWVGPPVQAIQSMGSKSQSKSIMEKANVPLVPGYHGDNQNLDVLTQEINRIGFPVLIKASAGGGGKGMRVVHNAEQVQGAIEGAKREGLNSFGDDKLLAERYINQARHVEIQVFLDEHGNGVYLFERDCSIQRRHQKIIEEAPAPHFPQSHREAMGEAAIKAAKAINYVGAGTVEFLYDPSQTDSPFYFMEMNTRLQVEHPITEMITGQDLVSWQLKVAQGEVLPLKQDALFINGHAMEVRVYAEDPANDFLPTTGQLSHINSPEIISSRVRLDTGVQAGDIISPYYDPMISKLIVWGETREQCRQQLIQSLSEYSISGVTTNLSFLRQLINIDDFKQGLVNTHFIEQHDLELNNDTFITNHILAATAYKLLIRQASADLLPKGHAPWHQPTAFRLNQPCSELFEWQLKDESLITVEVEHIPNSFNSNYVKWNIRFKEEAFQVSAEINDLILNYYIDDQFYKARVHGIEDNILVIGHQGETQLKIPSVNIANHQEQQGDLSAPMNGTIIQVTANINQSVKAGDVLMIMEAMKMEHAIKAPYNGIVKVIHYATGDLVDEGTPLIEIEEVAES